MQSARIFFVASNDAWFLAWNIRVPVVDLNRPSPIGYNSNQRSTIYIRPHATGNVRSRSSRS